jgi:Holliday junction DNA helicase RuvA
MISRIKGQVIEVGANRVVVDVSGIGYELLVPQPLLDDMKIGAEVELLTHHHVRENLQELYGFADGEAKNLFEHLLGVSGIGPKSALAIMSLGDQQRLRQAIANEDSGLLAAASGVGKRSAERVIVELKDKVGIAGDSVTVVAGDDATAALLALGYNSSQAARALNGLDSELSVEQKVKEALRKLS